MESVKIRIGLICAGQRPGNKGHQSRCAKDWRQKWIIANVSPVRGDISIEKQNNNLTHAQHRRCEKEMSMIDLYSFLEQLLEKL